MTKEKRMDTLEEYPYETCDICGNRITLIYIIKDDDWINIWGNDGGCLCIGCLDRIAQQKKIKYEFDLPTAFLRWDGVNIPT